MADDRVDVKIGAQIDGLKSGMNEAVGVVKTGFGQIENVAKSSYDAIGSSIKALTGTMSTLLGALAGGAVFKEMVAATNNWNSEVVKLSRTLGITTQEASTYAVALRLIGKDTGEFADATYKLVRQLGTKEERLVSLGLVTRDYTTGAFLPLNELFRNALSTILSYKEGIDRNAASMEFFGRSASDMVDYLKLTNDLMDKATTIAQKYNLVVGTDGALATKKFKEGMNELKLESEALKINIGELLIPTLASLTSWFNEALPAAISTTKKAIGDVKAAWDWMVGPFVKDVKSVFGPAATGYESTRTFGKIPSLSPHTESIEPPTERTWSPEPKKEKGGGKEKSRLSEWQTELDEMLDAESDFGKKSRANELEFWQDKLAMTEQGSAEYNSVYHKIVLLKRSVWQQEAADAKDAAQTQIEISRDTALSELAIKADNISTLRSLGQISATEELALLRSLETEKYNVQYAALQQRLGVQNLEAKEVRKLYQEMYTLANQYKQKMVELANTEKVEISKKWSDLANTMKSSFSNAISGMITGTTKFKDAVKSVFSSLVSFVSGKATEMAWKWISSKWTELAATKTVETAKTLAVQAGETSRLASQESAAATGIALQASSGSSEIMNSAATAYANTYASVSSVPFVGWILAPILAGVAFAAVLAMKGLLAFSAAGGYDVDKDSFGMVHAGEMVLPAHLAENVRNMTGKGGQTTLVIYTNDAKSFEQQLSRSNSTLNKEIKKSVRNFKLSPRMT